MENIINHVALVIDNSGSMYSLSEDVISVVDKQVQHLADLSKRLNQETRVSIYLFNDTVNCIIFDKDVLRLPSISGLYKPRGSTALLDAIQLSIFDLRQTYQAYGDHSFLIMVITDGGENSSKNSNSLSIQNLLKHLNDNWTIGILVPDATCMFSAQKLGIPKGNISQWNASSEGLEEVGNSLKSITNNYLSGRSKGIRSFRNIFELDVTKLNKTNIKRNLKSTKDFTKFMVNKDMPIKDFVELKIRVPYVLGNGYYSLTKPEKIQPNKEIAIEEIATGKIFVGDDARDLLGLPDYEVKVSPISHKQYNIYIQSTSVNRKLLRNTNILYRL